MEKFLTNMVKSLTPDDSGFSLKKELAAFGFINILAMSWYIIATKPEMSEAIIISLLAFVGAVLGIGAVQNVQKQKIETNDPNKTKDLG